MMSELRTNYLKMYRKRTYLSQGEVASLLGGQSGSKVARYEGDRRVPPLDTALGLSVILDTPVRELFLGRHSRIEAEIRERAKVLLAELEAAKSDPVNLRKWQAVEAVAGDSSTTLYVPDEDSLD